MPATALNKTQDIGETRAKGAVSVGLIWVLIASLAGAVLALAMVWAVYGGRLANDPASAPHAPVPAHANAVR